MGIALIGGIIAFINRRGGCTKKRDRTKSEFEDYGLGDFPHHRPSTNTKPLPVVSPTIPRLNDQGNYYVDDGYGGHYNGGYVDPNMDYAMQQQAYYYPEQQQQQQYYNDSGYYYDNSNTSGTYTNVQHSPMQQNSAGVIPVQQSYSNMPPPQQQQNMYKPDEAPPAVPHK